MPHVPLRAHSGTGAYVDNPAVLKKATLYTMLYLVIFT